MNGVKLNHWFFWSLLFVSLLAASLALSQTAPRMVGTVTGTGAFPLFETARTEGGRLSILQVTATTDMEFTLWSSTMTKLHPQWGSAAADTTLNISAGQTETYHFSGNSGGRPVYLYVTAGTGEVKGE